MRRLKVAALAVAAMIGLSANCAWADHGGGFHGGGGHGGFHGGGFRGGGFHGGGFHGGHEHHEGHLRGSIFFGPAFFWPGYGAPFDDPFYSYPPAPTMIEPPPVYIEKGDGNSPPDADTSGQLWYYCEAAGAYYPYVRECPGGWKAVTPQ